ncbi:hypothetical protein MKW98_007114 [Papaver atlanticum]|uniref:Probable threonine--tRNA ligase, cytoplasmic n=1 Tax=Papaver atlanticum TaxID=357466 RepID=A0AAD4SP21_9MAGN|nr:hypothetical protein MKW98_007114 [Papaver atlanticum]
MKKPVDRIQYFDSINIQQIKERQLRKKWMSPEDVASEIDLATGSSVSKEALVAKVNGSLWDMNRPFEGDCQLEFFTFDSDEGRDALERQYGCKLCTGSCSARGQEGFHYDAFYGDLGLNEADLKRIEKAVKKVVNEKQPFELIEVTRQQALEMFSENKFKVEIIEELPEDKAIAVYRCGPLVDLCSGPHIPSTSFIKAISLLKASSAYWRGNKERESLQRVYGISFPDRKRLKEYLDNLEEAKNPGSPFIKPHGTRIYNKLVDFMKSQYWERGYVEVMTPNACDMELWKTSGHADKYKENMFVFKIDKQEFGLKPMNCPGHCLMFDDTPRSYKELPLRMAEFGVLHRNETSGALSGLTRVRRFVQDDAQIFCRESQIKAEVSGVLEFIRYVYVIFGFSFELELSTRPEKYLGEIEIWDKAEDALTEALNEFGRPWKINEGDGAFYGPKIDISVFDAMKRKFQCATLQLDFQLPCRFKLPYSAEDGARKEQPVMIHILGSIECMLAILLEHYKGKWPFWLSPRQEIVCPISEKFIPYAQQVKDKIHKAGYYVDVDVTDRKIAKKIREAQLAQYNYMLVVGEKEVNNQTVSRRDRDDSGKAEPTVMSVKEFLEFFKEEAAAFR